MNVVDFPINIGNRPPHSPPAFIPITFELAVLLGGLSAFLGSLLGLFKFPTPYHPLFESENFRRASDRRLLPVGRGPAPASARRTSWTTPGWSGRSTSRWWRSRSDEPPEHSRRAGPRPAAGLRLVGRRLRRGPDQPDGRPPAQGRRLRRQRLLPGRHGHARSRPPGTVPRQRVTGNPGAHHRQGGHRTTSPPSPSGWTSRCMRLGQKRYNITCGTCHGPLGDGDSIVARQMALRPPPSLMRLRRPAHRLHLRGGHQGPRPDGLLRRRAAGARALGGGGLRPGAAGQPGPPPWTRRRWPSAAVSRRRRP